LAAEYGKEEMTYHQTLLYRKAARGIDFHLVDEKQYVVCEGYSLIYDKKAFFSDLNEQLIFSKALFKITPDFVLASALLIR
jgi:hypothetical protein